MGGCRAPAFCGRMKRHSRIRHHEAAPFMSLLLHSGCFFRTWLTHKTKMNSCIMSTVGCRRVPTLFLRTKLAKTATRFVASSSTATDSANTIRLSKLISQHAANIAMSRREAERHIREGDVTVAGKTIISPHFLVDWKDASSSIKIGNKLLQVHKTQPDTRVWLVHKLSGEVVSERDPQGRPSLLDRLQRDLPRIHLKPIGRLDMSTEGLIIMTNNGSYARELELPRNNVHRTYRVRVHGKLTPYKLKAMRSGLTINNTFYSGMKVQIEETRKKTSSTNTWMRITCTEGKNRQIRKVLSHLGCKW